MKLIRQFLRLARPFWVGKARWREWLLLAAIIAFTLFSTTVSVWIAAWDKRFYDALAAFDGKAMPALIIEYIGYMAMIIACIVCGEWLQKRLVFRWRTHLTAQLEREWLGGHKHYRIQLTGEPDNPDQRIAEDVSLLAAQSISLLLSFINNIAKFSAFVGVLWGLSGVQTFELGGRSFTVHGYLVWVALAYSALSTLGAHFVGRKLKDLNIERQHREADYRAALLRVRDHAEQVAFYHGADAEQGRLQRRFRHIRDNWFRLTNCEFRYGTFWAVYVRISIFIPIIATLPMYLAKTLTFGDMMQTRTSFARIQDSFGWFTDAYRRLVEWAAVVERLSGFQAALDQTAHPPKQPENRGQNAFSGCLLALDALAVHTPQGQAMLRPVSLTARADEWLLFAGRSGIGKSTLLRVLAGLWPYHGGHYQIEGSRLFLPQRPYLPYDSLRAAVCYPHAARADDALIQAALEQVGLSSLKHRLDEKQEWHSHLSGGEQQRLSLARALVLRPQILFLDEATNQLDDASALELMQTLKRELPDTLIIGISHQRDVQALFERRITLEAAA